MLVHRFDVDGHRYVYDAGANAVLEIDPVVSDVLPYFETMDEESIVQELAVAHDRQSVCAALTDIKTAANEQGLFLPLNTEIARDGRGSLCWDNYDFRLRQLTLTITEGCNLRCRYCLHDSTKSWVRPHGTRAMSKEVALKALSYFADHSADTVLPVVTFYGGEPLLEFGLIKRLVTEAVEHSEWPPLQFIIATNATLLDDAMIDFVLEYGVRLQISLDGPSEQHDTHRQFADGRPTHHLVEAAITKLLRKDPSFASKLSFIATLAPPYDLSAVAEYYRKFEPFLHAGVEASPQVTLNVVDLEGVDLGEPHELASCDRALSHACTEYISSCVGGARQGLSPVLTSLFDPNIIKFYHRSMDSMPSLFSPTGTCQPGQRKLHVRTDGTFQPCERVGESLPIGHVDEGIDRQAVKDLYTDLYGAVAPRCAECWALRLCGLCFTALAPKNDVGHGCAEVPEDLCERVRARAESTLKLYSALLEGDSHALDFLADSTVE